MDGRGREKKTGLLVLCSVEEVRVQEHRWVDVQVHNYPQNCPQSMACHRNMPVNRRGCVYYLEVVVCQLRISTSRRIISHVQRHS